MKKSNLKGGKSSLRYNEAMEIFQKNMSVKNKPGANQNENA